MKIRSILSAALALSVAAGMIPAMACDKVNALSGDENVVTVGFGEDNDGDPTIGVDGDIGFSFIDQDGDLHQGTFGISLSEELPDTVYYGAKQVLIQGDSFDGLCVCFVVSSLYFDLSRVVVLLFM